MHVCTLEQSTRAERRPYEADGAGIYRRNDPKGRCRRPLWRRERANIPPDGTGGQGPFGGATGNEAGTGRAGAGDQSNSDTIGASDLAGNPGVARALADAEATLAQLKAAGLATGDEPELKAADALGEQAAALGRAYDAAAFCLGRSQ